MDSDGAAAGYSSIPGATTTGLAVHVQFESKGQLGLTFVEKGDTGAVTLEKLKEGTQAEQHREVLEIGMVCPPPRPPPPPSGSARPPAWLHLQLRLRLKLPACP
jgi:hypothetical protein